MGMPEVPASLRSWMSAVSEIVRSVNAAEPLGTVLTRVAVQACELIGFEFRAVMLADEGREYPHIAGYSGPARHAAGLAIRSRARRTVRAKKDLVSRTSAPRSFLGWCTWRRAMPGGSSQQGPRRRSRDTGRSP